MAVSKKKKKKRRPDKPYISILGKKENTRIIGAHCLLDAVFIQATGGLVCVS
jgi:hypothetical protein